MHQRGKNMALEMKLQELSHELGQITPSFLALTPPHTRPGPGP